LLAALSAIVALACALASARRLAWAVAPTSLDAGMLLDAVRDGRAWPRLQSVVAALPGPTWEGELFQALAEKDPAARDALVTEQLLELDWTAQRWARVPRVCASIATSAGFLFGCIALLQGLALPMTPSDDGSAPALGLALFSALNALTLGIAGTAFCVAVHLRARRIVRERHQTTERLVARLLALASGTES
jgi:hypothetical protein